MYRIGICDDDNMFCTQMENYLDEYAKETGVDVETEVFLSGEDYLRYMKKKKSLDILFLDIKLSGMDGISVGRQIRNDLTNETIQIVNVTLPRWILNDKGYL